MSIFDGGPPRAAPRAAALSDAEAALLIGLALLTMLGALVWVWGALTGVVFGSRAPGMSVGDVTHVLAALPGHAGDPRAAWPAGARRTLPADPAAFYGCGAVLLAATATVGVAVARRLGGGRRRGRSAQWATRGDVRTLRVTAPTPGRLVLGRVGGRLVAAEPRHSVLALAPTQSRKTTGLAAPALLEWEGPVIATSIKSDLVRDTIAWRHQQGEVRVFDPLAATGLTRAHWTPLAGCRDWGRAQEQGDRIARAVQPRGESAEFWAEMGGMYLSALLFAAARAERDITAVRLWVKEDADPAVRDDVLAALEPTDTGSREAGRCADALGTLRALWESDDRLLSSLRATGLVALKAYGDPRVQECSQRADISARWLLSGSNTLYLCATNHQQQRLEPLFITLISELVTAVYDIAAKTGEPIAPALLLLLDEAANIAAIPDLDVIASTGAGQGLQVVTICQDMQQMRTRWGERYTTIANNHRAKWIGAGTSDPLTLRYAADLLGDEEVAQVSTQTTVGERARHSTTRSSTWRLLAPAHVLREAPYGTGILVYGNLPPAKLTLRSWLEDRALRARVAGSHR